jgi:NAD(P)H-hydrate epimerase
VRTYVRVLGSTVAWLTFRPDGCRDDGAMTRTTPHPTGSTAGDPANGLVPVLAAATVPAVTTAQMRAVDRMMVEDVGVTLLQMMENAGRSLAELAIARFAPASVTVLAGPGNNGGGGLAAARHLANRGVPVSVVLTAPPPAGTAAEHQLRAAQACGVTLVDGPVPGELVIDALVGYGLAGPLRGRAAELAGWSLGQDAPVLALDAPSGLDTTTGSAAPGAVRTTATLTLALPKTGLVGAPEVGELYLADISVPRRVYAELGLRVPTLFDRGPIVRLGRPEDAAPERPATESGLAWGTPAQAARLIASGATFATAARIALVVGTLLTVVNLGGAITSGHAGLATALQAAANYLIPYVVSSLGVLSRTRVPDVGRVSREARTAG